jgi:MFS family permease
LTESLFFWFGGLSKSGERSILGSENISIPSMLYRKDDPMDRWLASYRQYHPLIWLLVGGTVFARGAAFMSLPFLAIYLSRTTDLNPLWIGIVLGLGPLAGTVGGFVGGHLSDRFGRGIVMVSTLFVWSAVFLGFALAKEVWVFMILNVLNGLCRSFFEPTSQALMADLTPPEKRIRVFGFRYMAINVGAAVGPLLGAYLSAFSGVVTFWITGTVYGCYALLLSIMMHRYRKDIGHRSAPEIVRFSDAVRVVRKDTALGYFILSGILVSIGYAQIESSLPLYLNQLYGEHNQLYPALLAVNATCVILLQIPLTRWCEKRTLLANLVTGTLLFSLGISCFALGTHSAWFAAGMVILTLGEIVSFPTSNLFIDRLAPESLRGTYFGASGFQSLGFFAGPALGGWLLDWIGGPWMYHVMACLACIGIVFNWLGYRAFQRRKKQTTIWVGNEQEKRAIQKSVPS